jgi:hypothetical protein
MILVHEGTINGGQGPQFVCFILQRAAQYIEDLIPTLRRLIQKAETPAKKKGNQTQVSIALYLVVTYSISHILEHNIQSMMISP